jgi:adenosylmethionine-8-amino-7-oxononanoate aminotransferase
MMVEMPKIPAPTCAHSPYGLTSPKCAIACAKRLEARFDGRPQNDFFLFAPPLTVTDDEIADILALLRRSLSQLEHEYTSGASRA